MLYPLKFEPLYKDYLWGGRELEKLGKDLPEGIVAESWEISSHKDGESIVKNGEYKGTKLTELIGSFGRDLLGHTVRERDLGKFPLLIKLIDAKDKLSVQVHPDNHYARINEYGEYGKNEMWYIVSAEPGAKIVYGVAPGVTKESFAAEVEEDKIESCLNYMEVSAGDAVNIPAGLVHAIGAGIVIAEIQQNSNVTYRVFDYNRTDNSGNRRPLHIEKALEVINFNNCNTSGKLSGTRVEIGEGSIKTCLMENKFFSVEKYELDGKAEEVADGSRFYTYTCLEGEGKIIYDGGAESISMGESILIPAALGTYIIEGKLQVIKSYVPNGEKQVLDLNGTWNMKRVGEEEVIRGTVPGSVYNDLLKAGKMEDPFYRDNEAAALELSKYSYQYERTFNIEDSQRKSDKLLLVCEGLDTLAEVYVNEVLIAKTNNMHRRYEFDIKAVVQVGENSIRVIFKSPLEFVEAKHLENPLWGVDNAVQGYPHLRKSHCMFGWDWGPQIPDMGIWRDIYIRSYNIAKLEDVYITQKHFDNSVQLNVRARLEKFGQGENAIKVVVTNPNGECIETAITAQNLEENIKIQIDNPKLWWPNGYGEQPLYKVQVILTGADIILDEKSDNIGLRTMTVSQETDQWGKSFAFNVNGISIFSMGADYIPEDNILARYSYEKTEKLIQNCVAANFNSIRIWGGAHYPEDYFYDLCDKYGLVIWHDFMFACAVYDLSEEFKENIAAELKDNIIRIRHHASLGLWCGNNEMETAWECWEFPKTAKLRTDYIKQFEVLFPEIVKKYDPATFYWSSSPSSGGSFDRANDENCGDMHDWSIWHGRKPFTDFRNRYPRFMSEFGMESFPNIKTVESFTIPEDRNIFSYVMESHQKCHNGNETTLSYIAQYFKYPKDFKSLLYTSQILQAEGIKYGVEHWRRNRGRCMGAIYWQLNDCWPVASWASIDYYGRWKALHYAAKKFFAPVLISACEEGTKASIHVSNETMRKVSGMVNCKLRDNKSKIIEGFSRQIEVEALTSMKCMDLDFSKSLNCIERMRNLYLEFEFIVDNKVVSSGTVMFVKPKHFNFADPQLKVDINEMEDRFVLNVSSDAYAKFVELDMTEVDGIFSDNYFDLSAGELKNIEIKKSDMSKLVSIEELKNQIKVRSVYDMFV
jgi:beta-mannosidase